MRPLAREALPDGKEILVKTFRGNPWAVLMVVSLGFFMTLLDLTIVNIAIPNMITKLHASLDDVLWVINAYALVLAVLVITAGRLGDLFGPRILFASGIALFTVASAACGLSPSPGWLIGFRAVQGLGAAMLMPQTLTIITNTFPPERRGAAFGVWGAWQEWRRSPGRPWAGCWSPPSTGGGSSSSTCRSAWPRWC